MNTPALLLLATLLLWGWHIDWLWVGITMGVILESTRFIKLRWDFSQSDLDRVWNLCVILFVAITAYVFTAGEGGDLVGDYLNASSYGRRSATLNQGARVVLDLFQWLPLTLYPIALTQALLARPGMDLSTFSWWLRRRRSLNLSESTTSKSLNIVYLYLGICLFSASAAPHKSWWFIAGLTGVVSWALWDKRPRGYSRVSWVSAVLCAVGLGVVFQFGLLKLRGLLQNLDTAIMSRLSGGSTTDVKESRTSMGSIGMLKLSGRILWRLETQDSQPPDLIREASYNLFRAPIWGASNRDFENHLPERDQQTWIMRGDIPALSSLTISGSLPKGRGLLPLSQGTVRLENLPVFLLQTNKLGMVRSQEGPSFVSFQALFNSGAPFDRPPDTNDLEISEEELPDLQAVAKELRLPRSTEIETLEVIEDFFTTNFKYSLCRGFEHLPDSNRTALGAFLTEHRSGHCEYFATATALLLRQAGIPSRYNVGFAVQEKMGDRYLVRERHAHAWCQAWIGHRWREIDTTPASWMTIESKRASPWQSLRDFFSNLSFEFSKWRWSGSQWKRYLNWLIVPLLVFAILRLFLTKPWNRVHRHRSKDKNLKSWPGQDSDYYLVEDALRELGEERSPHETISVWLSRIASIRNDCPSTMADILALHYRLRFDPAGLSREDRAQLKHEVAAWLELLQSKGTIKRTSPKQLRNRPKHGY